MDAHFDLADTRFAVGQPVARKEDPILLRGEGRYTDDLSLPGQAYAAIVRSAYAHGTLRGIDLDAARAASGVLGVFTADELERGGVGLMPVSANKNRDGSDAPRPPQPPASRPPAACPWAADGMPCTSWAVTEAQIDAG